QGPARRRTVSPTLTASLRLPPSDCSSNLGSTPQIRARDAFVAQQLGACASHDDATQVHHVGAIGEPQRAECVLLDEQHRDALSLELGQRVEDALHDHRRESERRFIEQQQTRLSQKRARDREHLLFPAGKPSREQRHAWHRLDRAVTNAELLDLEERRMHAASSLPRYASRTAGLAWISAGVPSAILRPKFSTATRSQVPITRRTSCSMSTMVSPSVTSARISSRRRADSAGFIPAAGSSRMRRRGSDASARAISRRRWSP